MSDLVQTSPKGLACPAGGFHVDPWRPVERAVITHAHADHARAGSKVYLTTPEGAPLLRRRVQKDAVIETLAYGERRRIGEATVSLHPAGHVLGSAQVRIEHPSGTWVVAGDYKTAPDPTCAAIEPVPCDVFITESTFGLPVFAWPTEEELIGEILGWWETNRAAGRTSLLCAYALGKAQRLLMGLGDRAPGPIGVHGAVHKLNEAYAEAGLVLPATEYASPEVAKQLAGEGLVIAPPSAQTTPWVRKFGEVSTGFASGWMRMRGTRRRRNFDRGFVVSDHADWNGLLQVIEATGAERVLVTHGYVDPLVRYLSEERGIHAAALETGFEGEGGAEAEPAGSEPAAGAAG